MMNKTRIIKTVGLALLAAVALAVLYIVASGNSLAWFVKTKQSDRLEFKAGKLYYILEYSENLKENPDGTTSNIIVPGDLLFSKLILTNKSTIESDMRLQITYTDYADPIDVVGDTRTYGVDPLTDKLRAELTLATADTPGFVWDGAQYWQWDSIPPNENTDGTVIPVMAEVPVLLYDGERSGNEFNGKPGADGATAAKPVTVKLTFQMKQKAALDWIDAFTISRTTQVGGN